MGVGGAARLGAAAIAGARVALWGVPAPYPLAIPVYALARTHRLLLIAAIYVVEILALVTDVDYICRAVYVQRIVVPPALVF